MQKNTAVGETLIPRSASEGAVLTVLSQLKNGKIEEALASFADPLRAKGNRLFLGAPLARDEKSPFGSLRIARTKPPPCAPVAPITAIIFLPLIVTFFVFFSTRRLHRG
jgi:hypothetical protein